MPSAFIAAAAAGYLLGSLPFGWLVARLHGVDIFAVGSKSSGATNVGRVLGPGPRNLVFALDAAKGMLAAGWPLGVAWARGQQGGQPDGLASAQLLGLAGLIFALVGHSFSCFTRFRGGKGVATGAGGFLVLLPLPTLASAAVWLAVFYLARYVSLASICSAVALPLGAWILGDRLGGRPLLTEVAAAVGIFVIVRHRANIVRLLAGTEHKGGRQD